MKPSEELLAMRELLAAPGAWTQGTHARDKFGESISPRHAFAVCRCLRGAQIHLSIGNVALYHITDELFRSCGQRNWVPWNDAPGRTHLEVVEMLERAVLAARESEGETNG